MNKYLLTKGFKEVKQDGLTGYVKRYKGFTLTIATIEGIEKFYAAITIKDVEIGLPEVITVDWLETFDEQNEDLLP